MDVRPSYKQTEIGVIPKNWEPTPLERIAAFITKGSTPTTYGFAWQNEGVLFLRSECVSERGLELSQSMFIAPEAHQALRRSEVRSGDILMTITGNVGRVVHLGKDFGEANINQHIARIRIENEQIAAPFVFHFLSQPVVRRYYNLITTGQAYPQISLKQVRETEVPIPIFAEQAAIADALSDADALIVSHEQLIAKKRQIRQGTIQELLRPKEGWSNKKLGSLGVFLKGSGVRKNEAMSGELPCIRYGEIYTKHNEYIKRFHSWISKDVAASAKRLRKGDFLFAGSGETKEEIGKCVAFVDDFEAYAGGDIVILRPENVNPVFMGYYLNTGPINRQKASKGQGDAVVHIGATALAGIDVAIPGFDEQTAVATILSDMDAEITALEAKLAKARQIKQGMMHNLLTGKIRLI